LYLASSLNVVSFVFCFRQHRSDSADVSRWCKSWAGKLCWTDRRSNGCLCWCVAVIRHLCWSL